VALNPNAPLLIVADLPKLWTGVIQIAVWLFSAVRWTSFKFDKLHGSGVLKT
jgi:hypothetical protein